VSLQNFSNSALFISKEHPYNIESSNVNKGSSKYVSGSFGTFAAGAAGAAGGAAAPGAGGTATLISLRTHFPVLSAPLR